MYTYLFDLVKRGVLTSVGEKLPLEIIIIIITVQYLRVVACFSLSCKAP